MIDGRAWRSRSRARAPTRCRSTRGTWWSARCGPPSRRWTPRPPGLRLPAPTRSRTAAGSARPRPRSSPGSCLARGAGRRRLAADGRRRACSASPPSSRATPTTSRPRSTAGSWSPAATTAAVLGRAAPGRPADQRGRASCRRPRCRTELARGLLPADVPHADAAANAGRAALLVAALGGQPDQLLAATRDRLHQRTGVPPCRSRSPWSRRCAPTGCRP